MHCMVKQSGKLMQYVGWTAVESRLSYAQYLGIKQDGYWCCYCLLITLTALLLLCIVCL